MKKIIITIVTILSVAVAISGCVAKVENNEKTENIKTEDTKKISAMTEDNKTVYYEQISQEQAKKYMDSEEEYAVVLDVRTFEEYEEEHIEGALCIPVESLNEELITQLLPSKEQMILVYCRSGNRSKEASEKLASYGYTNVKEFGGINDWKYKTEK